MEPRGARLGVPRGVVVLPTEKTIVSRMDDSEVSSLALPLHVDSLWGEGNMQSFSKFNEGENEKVGMAGSC